MTVAPEIRINGVLLKDQWLEALVEMRAERGLRSVGTLTLRFTDPGYALSSTTMVAVGALVEVGAVGGGELAKGAVTGIAVEQREGLPPELVVTARDEARRLAGSPVVRTFTEMSFRDAAVQVAQAAGLGTRFPPAPGRQAHILQVGTALDFVDEMADRLSWDWWVEGRTLVAEPPGRGPAVRRSLGTDLQEFSVSVVDVPESVGVRGWDPWRKVAVTSKPAPVSAAAGLAKGQLVDRFTATTAPKKPAVEVIRSVANQDEADAVAVSLRDSVARAAVTAHGRGPADAAIGPGVTLTVTDAGPLSGEYYVSRVEHVYRRTGFHTRFVAGDRTPATLVDLLGGREEVGRGRADAGTRFYGLMCGVVTDSKDPEKRGRVRVEFPAFGPKETSDWARVATIGAGGERGLMVIPEVDDEVLVAFEGGDLRRPVVLAGLHNEANKIPQHDVSHGVAHRRFTSRLGHVIELADGADLKDQHILIALAGGQDLIRLGKDRMDVRLPMKRPMTITVGQTTIAVDGDNRLTVEAQEVSVTARGKLTLSGQNVEIKAVQKLSASAMNLESKATAVASLESDGLVTVKGKSVAIN